jgi:hypothetical protein
MRALAVLPVFSIGKMVSSVATTCEVRTRSAINSYNGSTRSATSPHQTDCVAREDLADELAAKSILADLVMELKGRTTTRTPLRR